MASAHFDAFVRSLRASRRSLLGGALVTAAGLLRIPNAEAKKRRKRRHKKEPKKAKSNAFGCFSVGQPCKRADQCCSGICEGKNGKRTCRAHDTGTCNQEADGLCTAVNPRLAACDNSNFCACFRSTAGSNVCASVIVETACAECRKDADCAALGFPAGSACLPFFQSNCAGRCETGMACLPPCGTVIPFE